MRCTSGACCAGRRYETWAVVDKHHCFPCLVGEVTDSRALGTGIGDDREIEAMLAQVVDALVAGVMRQVGQHDHAGLVGEVMQGGDGTIDGVQLRRVLVEEVVDQFGDGFRWQQRCRYPGGECCH